MTVVPWRTAIDDAAIYESGWEALRSGAAFTRRPLIDAREGLYARLTYRDAIAVAAREGARLPSRGEVLAALAIARAYGLLLAPVTLSYGPEMVTHAHAVEHDRRVAEQLAAKPGHDGQAIGNIGKHWISGAAPGRSRICGWMRPNGSLIQAGTSDPHDDMHHDYATTTLLVRDL